MPHNDDTPVRVRWARLRYVIIGPLLEAPPDDGELKTRIEVLAAKAWRHPTTFDVIRFSFKTIERWFYAARAETDPIATLARKVPKHAGTHPSVSSALAEAIVRQYRAHMRWSFQLHYDNLVATSREDPALAPMPGYATVRRYGLWHLDFHEGSRAVLTAAGEWKKPQALGILDDRSRLCCHLQWYFEETADALTHGLAQAIQKRGLPRALLTDNGAAMLAAETREGLERLGIVHHTTLPYSPEQNGKQESFWGQVEGRLVAMLEGEPSLSLALLNTATQAWVEHEYHQREHSEIKETPLTRFLRGPSVGRESPSSDALRSAFRTEITRTQRRSDGTVTACGIRFEIPAAYRTLLSLRLRIARWDLSTVELVDPRSGKHLASLLPLDKAKNAEGIRRVLPHGDDDEPRSPVGIAPHLRALMAEYAATGFPPAFIPKPEKKPTDENDEDT